MSIKVRPSHLLLRTGRKLVVEFREYDQEAEERLREIEMCKAEIQRLIESKESIPVTGYGSKSRLDLLKERLEFLIYDAKSKKGMARGTKTLAYELLVLTIFIEFWRFFALLGDAYTRSASTFVEQSIDMLAPTIPAEKVLDLRAKYRSVNSSRKFDDLYDELQLIAKEKNNTLPKNFIIVKR